MNDATRLRIRRELAERMGFLLLPTDSDSFTLCFPSGEPVGGASWPDPADVWSDAPDPFTDHEDAAALVEWLAANDYKSAFGDELLKATGIRDRFLGDRFPAEFHIADLLTSPLEARVLAACAALGISTGDE